MINPSTLETLERVPRREREKLARRKDILDAAKFIFATKGFNDATLDDVAERSEFGKGTLYNYFTNKEALFGSILEESFADVYSYTNKIFSSSDSFDTKVESFIRETFRYFFNDPESFHLMTREASHLRENNPMLRLVPDLLKIIAESIEAEQRKRKIVNSLQPQSMAIVLIHMIFGQFLMNCIQCSAVHNVSEPKKWAEHLFQAIHSMQSDVLIETSTTTILTIFFNGIKSGKSL